MNEGLETFNIIDEKEVCLL